MSMISFLNCICWFCYSLNIFSNQFDHYCLTSIKYFLRNGAWNSQKRTFARRQWAQYLLFLFFTQHLFKSIWSLLFDINQLFSQKWSPKVSKANFCSKTVGTVFAVFCFSFTIFHNQLITFVCCQSIIFSEMEPETLKSELLLEDSGYSICCFCSSLNIFSNQFDHYCLTSINYFLRNEARRSQKRTFARRQWAQYLLILLFTQHLFQSFWSLLFDVNQLFSQKWSPKLSKANFCSKTVGTAFAVFFSSSNIFSNQFDYYCLLSINFFSEMESEVLKSEVLLEDSEYNICCFFSHLNISRKLWCRHH